MIGSLRTRVSKEPIVALYFKFKNELKFYNLEARTLLKKNGYKPDEVKSVLKLLSFGSKE